jgi:nanoRNase/pAp phosphatase (c-di-AMP/oligoRNAs hydrolase)
MNIIIYHANCYDGLTAAWIARQKIPGALVAAKYGDTPPNVKDRNVWILDFSYPRAVMEWMNSEAKSLTVLDHHKTAQENCKGLGFCNFDMERSGCRMAWAHFFPDDQCPEWIKRVEDRDLWRFKYPDTKDVHAYIASIPMEINNWDAINETSIESMVVKGSAIRRYIETYIEKACQEVRQIITSDGHIVSVLNIPYQNASETASAMLELHPEAQFSMSYFQRKDGCWQYSLRSRSEFDVSAIAKSFGGGGHAQAAGFETKTLLPELRNTHAEKV